MAIKFSVELPLFFAFFSFSLINTLNTNLIIYRTCYLILGLDKNNCSLLGNVNNATTEALEKIVQPKADVIMMTKTSIDSGFGAILCLFVGSWSDRFGRKPVIVANFIGYTVMMWIMTAFAALEQVSPWYMLMCTIPVVLSGGGASFLTILLAYLTDITSVEHRGLQMGIFEAFMGAAVLLGNLTSPYLLSATNYVMVYLVATFSLFFGLLYVIFLIPESLSTLETENRTRGFFQAQNIVGMFKTTFRERLLKIPSTCISPMTKSMLSKLVEVNESAKIFAVFTIMSNLLGLVGAPLFTTLYNATMSSSPGIFNFVTGSGQAMNTIYLLVVIWLVKRTQSRTPYTNISDENRDAITTQENESDN